MSAPRRFHAIVANPPYIVSPTHEASEAYRARYVSAHRRFGLGAPFTERMFELAVDGGFIAQITSNAFMKREYGAPLIESVLPHYDLALVVDTSGAYIPGHGTPTVILATRNRAPSSDKIRVVCSRRGEPETPKNHVGQVWASILRGLGLPAYDAPDGPSPAGMRWASALAKTAQALTADIAAAVKIDKTEAAPIAAAWITGAAALVAFNERRALCEGRSLPDDEHLARSFERVADELPAGAWFDPDAGVSPCWRHTITDAWSARIRAEVARVVKPSTVRGAERGRTDWIGDLYQGLDEVAVKRHAFCQTPFFVADFLCDLAVGAALDEYGPAATVLDPTCGTGHLLCESFRRLYLRRADPPDGAPEHTYPTCARLALEQVHGWDLNPVAAALAEWRLMLAYVDAAAPRHFGNVPDDLPINIRVCDTLTADRPEGRLDHSKRWPVIETPAVPTVPTPADPPPVRRVRDAFEQLTLFGGTP